MFPRQFNFYEKVTIHMKRMLFQQKRVNLNLDVKMLSMDFHSHMHSLNKYFFNLFYGQGIMFFNDIRYKTNIA